MTDGQKMKITKLRQDGLGYTAIAKQMGLSRDTIRGFCRRNGMAGEITIKIEEMEEQSQEDFCRECGKELQQTDGIKKRIFCCHKCHEKWWHERPDQIKQRAMYSFICIGCRKKCITYSNSHRKYCSHKCYVRSRFKGGDDNE